VLVIGAARWLAQDRHARAPGAVIDVVATC
jgi:hypothetical protein